MRKLPDFIQDKILKGKEQYSEYLKRRAEIADKYDHENGPEINKKMDELEQKEYDELAKEFPEAAERFEVEQELKRTKQKKSTSNIKSYIRGKMKETKPIQELPAEYLKELADIEDKYDHEFGSFEKNKQMDDEYNEKLAQLKKKYNIE